MVVMGFLAILPSEYESIKAQILSSLEISSFQETFSRILRTETSSSTPPSAQMSSALVGQNMGKSEKQQYKSGGPGGVTLEEALEELFVITAIGLDM